MGEIKSVKVDNWGVFFLQKLQNFFNKTDFCDLTLQFKDNSQLKVHRLVLSACTDFFNVLEQTCELMDDALVMPAELQADVVVPIVNFMYTGTLEFELKMYAKLLKTAKEMNMTVLLKLLEAHKRTMETSRMAARSASPKMKNKRGATSIPLPISKPVPPPQTATNLFPQRRLQLVPTNPTPNRRTMKPMQSTNVYKPSLLKTAPKMQRGPIRFEDSNAQSDSYESSFDAISYESKPLKEEPEEYMEMQTSPRTNRSSPFEQLRKGFNNNKRPAVATFTSPPAKKPNIEDVKEFSEQQRMRKQIAAEFGDDAEFDGILDDEFHHDDDDEDNTIPSPSSTRQQQQQQQQASIVIKQSPNEKPTIVVKDSSNSKMDHAKIISEVLRQYPHLVKSNKNIKLKIMPNVGGQTQKIIVKKETIDNMSAEMEPTSNNPIQQAKLQLQQLSQKANAKKLVKSVVNPVDIKTEAQPLPGSTGLTEIKTETIAAPSATKRRIDSKTMHALIAKGAENRTGPWLCLRCGVNGRPISIPSYRGFRRHLINTHKEVIDSALCEYCGWRSKDNRSLHHHMFVEHKVASLLYTFPECIECKKICTSQKDLTTHLATYHPSNPDEKQQCIYCNKVFNKEMMLYTHMKTFHKKRAREDGVIDFSDEEMEEFDNGASESNKVSSDKKIKILSDIALPSTLLNLEEVPSSVDEEFADESGGPKFVNADGNEMVLTAEQREEIMSQLDRDHDGGVVMVINQSTYPAEEAEGGGSEGEQVENEVKLETSDHTDEYEDQNIYSEFPSGAEAEFEGTADETVSDTKKEDEYEAHDQDGSEHEERMDDDDHMEWAENLISAHDADEETQEEEHEEKENDDQKESNARKTRSKSDLSSKREEEKVSSSKSPSDKSAETNIEPKKDDDISLKLKMLTGDWTDDEIDDEDIEEEERDNADEETSKQDKEKSQEPETKPNEDDSETKIEPKADGKEKQTETKEDEEKTAAESENEEESTEIAKASPTADAEDDEVTQSSKSLKDDEHDEDVKIKEEDLDETPPPTEDLKKSKENLTEVGSPDSDKQEVKEEKVTPPLERRSSRRKTSPKDASTKEAAKKDLSDSKPSSPLSSKKEAPTATSTTEDEPKEEEEDPESETVAAKEDTQSSKPTKGGESSKTPDKVKSLMSEWGDDDDDL